MNTQWERQDWANGGELVSPHLLVLHACMTDQMLVCRRRVGGGWEIPPIHGWAASRRRSCQ